MPDADGLHEKVACWRECLLGPDPNSVCQQVLHMTWDHAAYRLLLKARELAPLGADGYPQTNLLVNQFIDRNFWDSQILATRRLMDGGGPHDHHGNDGKSGKQRKRDRRQDGGIHGNKGVYSLGALVGDLRKNHSLLTRAGLFAANDLEYNLGEADKGRRALYRKVRRTAKACTVSPRFNIRAIEEFHRKIDDLAGVPSRDRSPSDTIPEELFARLQEKLDRACREIKLIANKCVAHAATPESRVLQLPIDVDAIALDLQQLAHAHEVFCKTARFLTGIIFHQDFFPSPWGCDLSILFDHLDKPIAKPEDVDLLHEEWRRFLDTANSWEAWSVSDLLSGDSASRE